MLKGRESKFVLCLFHFVSKMQSSEKGIIQMFNTENPNYSKFNVTITSICEFF